MFFSEQLKVHCKSGTLEASYTQACLPLAYLVSDELST